MLLRVLFVPFRRILLHRKRKGTTGVDYSSSRIPSSKALVTKLLGARWAHLHDAYGCIPGGQYPGVYILAYSNAKLTDELVRVKDIYYVGMSHAGVTKRLHRFIVGLECNRYHSAAKRFFRTCANSIPYTKLKGRKTFYFASVAVPCIVDKALRKPIDLRKMGEVAKCEFYVLAHVHEQLGREPELNRK